MEQPCSHCGFRKGTQKLVELSSIGDYLGIAVDKVHHS